jgi:predicted ferric reductase
METSSRLWWERWGGWLCICLFVAIPLVRWVFMMPLSDRITGAYGIWTTFGRLAGLIGIILFAINLLLSVRRRWLENFFGGINRVFIAHHITGSIAFIFILFHPLFLALRLVEIHSLVTVTDAAKFLLPRGLHLNGSFYDVEQAAAINNGIVAFIGLTGLMLVTFFTKLPYRVWLITHRFLGLVFVFAGMHVLFITSDVTNDLFLKLYIITWVVIGLGAYTYRTLLGNIFVRRAAYVVDVAEPLPHGVTAISLRPVEKAIDFRPGQFVFVRFLWAGKEGISRETHPFSIASSPTDDHLRLYIKSLGDYTKQVAHLNPGTIAEIEGAFGRFLPERFKFDQQLWIAGGIGITPFLSMVRSYTADSPAVTLIYCTVERDELLDMQIMAEYVPKTYTKFMFIPFVGKEHEGHLTADTIQQLSGPLAGKEIFICGPPPMMHALRAQLRAKGVSARHIHTEEFSMS